jgi:hypothetical protein
LRNLNKKSRCHTKATETQDLKDLNFDKLFLSVIFCKMERIKLKSFLLISTNKIVLPFP